jgi:IMP dehydrogenase
MSEMNVDNLVKDYIDRMSASKTGDPLAAFSTALTFDDILLVPQHSTVLPHEVDVSTRLTRRIRLNVPLVSAAMDTVTESRLAIAMAQHGGIGIIHKNLAIDQQASEVDRVKRSESGMIVDPITLSPAHRIYEALDLMKKYRISGVPITEDGSKEGRLCGILTNRDLRFETNVNRPIEDVMTREPLFTVPVGTTLDAAREILHQHKVEKLLVVDREYRLKGLITVKDIQKAVKYPNASKDHLGRLRCGAAIGIARDTMERAEALVAASVDVLVIDTAHGHSQNVLDMVRRVRKSFPDADLVAGNVATPDGTLALISEGVDAVKVGIGAGSICTTRVVAGIGVPMITAIMECARAADAHDIPVIADGGIRFSGDITKALAVGASTTMIGNLFAGTDESPGELILYQGRSYKEYRGMGSIGAMRRGSRDRYFQDEFELDAVGASEKLVPEGIEGRVAHKGGVAAMIHQLVGGLRAGMGYCGAARIPVLQRDAKLIRITPAGFREGHVHDVAITQEAPNYRSE